MSDSDKMRDEFEAWAAREEYNLVRYSWPDEKHSKGYGSEYADNKTTAAEHGYQAGYQAGRKAEREGMQKEALQQLVDEAQKLDMGY